MKKVLLEGLLCIHGLYVSLLKAGRSLSRLFSCLHGLA